MEVRMMLFLKLAWRNIWRHKRRTIILIVSVTLSLSMMMFYDGFVEGFQNAVYANAIKSGRQCAGLRPGA